jgi:hypothetical protein
MLVFSQGKTYDFVIHGVFLCILGILMILIHPFFAVIVVVGIALALMTSGVQIDVKNKQIRKRFAAGPISFGDWRSLQDITKITLRYNGHQGNTYRPIYLNKGATSLRSYDLVLTNKFMLDHVLFEFTDYKLAQRVLNSLAQLTDCELDDHIQRRQLEQLKKRR